MATIKEIAEKTGVSIATVSRVLNQDKNFNVSEQTRLDIMRVAEELNYKVKTKKENKEPKAYKFGLVYWYTSTEELNDPYYFSIRMAIEYECKEHNVEIENIYIANNNFSVLENQKYDGLIALGKYSNNTIDKLYSINNNLVVVDCWMQHYNVDFVIPDLESATKEIIKYYLNKNINKIGFIGGVETTFDGVKVNDSRLITYQYEMMKINVFNDELIHLGEFTADSGYEIMNSILKTDSLVDGYIVGSDAMALGCLKALNENHINVPEVVSIFSYDNTSFSQFTIPSLSTVDMNTQLMGQSAVVLLLERINNERSIGKRVIIPIKLITRDSVIK